MDTNGKSENKTKKHKSLLGEQFNQHYIFH